MKVLFTAGNSFVGRAIRYMTREPVSHVALQIGDLVVHSTLFGPEVRSINYFNKKYKIVYTVDLPDSHISVAPVLDRYDKRAYDYWCLVYLGMRYAALRALGIALPKVNLWEVSGMYTCTEFVTGILLEKPDSMITPYGLFLKMKQLYGHKEIN